MSLFDPTLMSFGPAQVKVQPHVSERLCQWLRAGLTLPEELEIHVTQWRHSSGQEETLLVWFEAWRGCFEHLSFELRAEAITTLHLLRALQARWGTLLKARHHHTHVKAKEP